MQEKTIRLHHYEPVSWVNGPGARAVIWVQGCALGCPGCFNPQTHASSGGQRVMVDTLAAKILADKDNLEGLTISGGEPLYQYAALTRLLTQIRAQSNLSILVFTGYDWNELQQFRGIDQFLAQVDVLIAGRYDASRRIADGLIGSSNKVIHFLTQRYNQHDLDQVPQAEIIISPEGEVRLSGIDPLQW